MNKQRYRFFYNTPIGGICVEEEEGFITGLYSVPEEEFKDFKDLCSGSSEGLLKAGFCETALVKKTYNQLKEYFEGSRRVFDVPVKTYGTDFQEKVWQALRQIPYGQTISYGQLAKNVGNPKACRAVGGANNKNRIMIIIPCHRVIGADGSLTGFAAGVDMKRFLLEHEYKNLV